MKKIAILRGINVSGQKKIKMADLKSILESENLKEVQTYIQSGNLSFQFTGSNEEAEQTIITAIKKHYNFDVPTIVVAKELLEEIVEENPLKKEAQESPKQTMVTFFASNPIKEKTKALQESQFPNETIVVHQSHAYLYTPKGYGKAKLSNNFIEKKLGVACTTRNWTTVEKLLQMTND